MNTNKILHHQRTVLGLVLVLCLPCHGLLYATEMATRSSRGALSVLANPSQRVSRSHLSFERTTFYQTRLHLQKAPNEDETNPLFQVPSVWTLVIDALAILLAIEFVGLLREVNDENFVRNGGWLAPLPTLQEQSNSISKVIRGWILNMALWTTTLTVVPTIVGQEIWSRREANPWTSRFVPAFFTFTLLRILYAILGVELWMHGSESVAVEAALLDAYMVGLLLATARYLLGNEE